MRNAFTIDVEDYFQVAAFEKTVSREDWDRFPIRTEENTRRLLDLLRRREVRATFFLLGWIARRCPDLVRRINAEGHEVAAHGFDHRLIYRQTEEEFRDDVRRTRELLRELSGQEVCGYRAPSWSITARTPWALQILVEEGFTYDSSVFPIRHDLHGTPGAPREIHRMETEAGPIREFPPAVVRVLGRNIPTGGGGYFRLYPYVLTRSMLRSINAQGRPFTFYVHPWEIDPDQPRFAGAPLKSRFRHYVNLKRTAAKLERLFDDFAFAPMIEVLDTVLPCFTSAPAPGD